MNYTEERAALMQPLADAGLGVPILVPGLEQPQPEMSGNPEVPTRWILFDVLYPGAEYLTFDGTKQISGLLELTCYVEPIAGDAPMRQLIDALEAAFVGADQSDLVFHTQQASVDEFGEDGGWMRWDWRLPYFRFNVQGGVAVPYSPKAITVSLSADQIGNITPGNRVEFDEIIDTTGHIVMGSGATLGVFSLPVGRFMLISTGFANFSSGGSSLVSMYWMPVGGVWPDDQLGGGGSALRPMNSSSAIGGTPVLATTYNALAPTDVELRIITNNGGTAIGLNTTATIFSIP